MSKKIIVLIEFVVCVLAVVIVSVFGNNPETWRDFKQASEISVEVPSVRLEADADSYQLVWKIGPEDVTVKEVTFSSQGILRNYITIDESGLVTFLEKKMVTIIIRTTDGSNLSVSVDISFKKVDVEVEM